METGLKSERILRLREWNDAARRAFYSLYGWRFCGTRGAFYLSPSVFSRGVGKLAVISRASDNRQLLLFPFVTSSSSSPRLLIVRNDFAGRGKKKRAFSRVEKFHVSKLAARNDLVRDCIRFNRRIASLFSNRCVVFFVSLVCSLLDRFRVSKKRLSRNKNNC